MLWISEKVLIKMQGTATKTIASAPHQKFYSFCSINLHWTLCKTTKFGNSWFTLLLLDSFFNTQLCHKCLGPLLLWAASLTNLNGLCVLGKTSIQKKRFLSAIAWMRGRSTPARVFWPFSRSAFLVNKKSLFLQKCQCIEL